MEREHQLNEAANAQAAEAWETFHAKEEASPTDHRDFHSWMLHSPRHVAAYLRVCRTMHALRSERTPWPDTPVETLIREAKAYTGQVVTTLRDEAPRQVHGQRRRVPRTPLAIALAAMLLVAIGAAWIMAMQPQVFETSFGEQRFVRLDDGSGVTLNTASRIEVKLTKGHRVVRLLRGEALFDVAHDRARPFDVYVGETILRAVGTRFDVDVRPRHTTVTVVEGVVSLTHGAREATPLGNTPLLHPSDRVVIDSSGPGTARHGIPLDETTAWTRQQLVFHRRPLAEVADEFNRYNRERIVIQSRELQTQEVTGAFKTNQPESLLNFLSSLPGVRVRNAGDGAHVVTLDDSGS